MMRSLFFLILSLFSFSAKALHLEAGAGMAFSDLDFRENRNSSTSTKVYQHDGMGAGAEIFGRAGISSFNLSLGVTGSWQRTSAKIRSEDIAVSDGDKKYYNSTTDQKLLGGFVGFRIPMGFRLIGEYYSKSHLTYEYAEPHGRNPFAENDVLKGKGYAIGIGFQKIIFSGMMLYRHLQYERVGLTKEDSDHLNNSIGRPRHKQLVFQFSFIY